MSARTRIDATTGDTRISEGRLLLLRVVVLLTVLLGVNYIAWRWLFSLNWDAWWIAIPLIAAETYSLIDVCLFGMMMWRARGRPAPPPPVEGLAVDVFIATYNEPIDLVMTTALAARRIRYPHRTWILDDGARPELRRRAEAAGVGYVSRGAEWDDRPRHAKAGNINNALQVTDGEFILILDADMIPRPEILDHTLGYFDDPSVALVQTPQVFSNVATGDPLGSQAPLFYGPIQQGKDGWNAAFFCGSNAILRREALMQLGIVGYVRELDRSVSRALRSAARVVERSRTSPAAADPAVAAALDEVAAAVAEARARLRAHEPLGEVTYRLHRRVDAATRSIVASDVAGIDDDLRELAALAASSGAGTSPEEHAFDVEQAVAVLTSKDLSPLNALEAAQAVLRTIGVDRAAEAQPVMPLATISVTEDMATSMRMHGMGWKSVYHHELLADGLAPEDLGTMLTQRLRWAQGTMQVFLRENPLVQWGMSLPQRLMYFATMWSYLSGYAAVVYFAAPIIFLVLGILPVHAYAGDFFARFIPFMVVNQVLFLIAAKGAPTWRGQQYSLALFPVWLKACSTAFTNVVLRIPLGFAVTPKTRPSTNGPQWHLIKTQLVVMALLVVAIVVGCIRLLVNGAEPVGTAVNIAWAVYDLVVLSVLFQAATFRGYDPATEAEHLADHARRATRKDGR
ncbi:glycosyltransferase [Microbacterium sp. SORGH_AS_0888]|uniref:glycosyltransferase n=1 Tax=Microbacterium sp. SORGH_AS_0888 TaxID=3041791 RepID=UPI00277E34CB|nr:glycosyltransferase [Microbacterium sp. SORGH_AS_0888]MDQ1130710.1 cellulose synthase (UDP-forming) [Microbacterium sp. SORGH_AS_0888]